MNASDSVDIVRNSAELSIFSCCGFLFDHHPERSPARLCISRRLSAGAARSRRISAHLGAWILMRTRDVNKARWVVGTSRYSDRLNLNAAC